MIDKNGQKNSICAWGYMLKKLRVGMQVGFVNIFLSLFFSIKRAHGTMKQNLVKFEYTQVIN